MRRVIELALLCTIMLGFTYVYTSAVGSGIADAMNDTAELIANPASAGK